MLKSTGALGSAKKPAWNCLVALLNRQMLATAWFDRLTMSGFGVPSMSDFGVLIMSGEVDTSAAMLAIGVPHRRRHDDLVATTAQLDRRVRTSTRNQDAGHATDVHRRRSRRRVRQRHDAIETRLTERDGRGQTREANRIRRAAARHTR